MERAWAPSEVFEDRSPVASDWLSQLPRAGAVGWGTGAGGAHCLSFLKCVYFLVKRQAPGIQRPGSSPRGNCTLQISAVFPRTHPDDDWAPAPPVFPATHRPELHQGCWPQSGLTWICLGPRPQNVWLMKADPWRIVRSHCLLAHTKPVLLIRQAFVYSRQEGSSFNKVCIKVLLILWLMFAK